MTPEDHQVYHISELDILGFILKTITVVELKASCLLYTMWCHSYLDEVTTGFVSSTIAVHYMTKLS